MSEETTDLDLQQYAIEQGIARLNDESARVDAFMTHVKWIVSVVSSIVVVVVGFVTFLGISNLNEIGKQVAEDAKSRVRLAIQKDEQNILEIKRLSASLKSAHDDYVKYREAIDSLSLLPELSSIDRADPYFAYQRLRRLEAEEYTPANRGTALKLLDLVIQAGERGVADPNILFNSAVVAAKLSLDLESAKLAVLAAHWRPSRSHRAREAQATEILGKTYRLEGERLELVDSPPAVVRKAAWNDLLEMVRLAPRVEGEHIYSTASNVAVNNRSAGYQAQLAEAILDSERRMPEQLSSYAYVTLARMYARQGEPGWKEKYWMATRKALAKLKQESPIVSWYSHSAEDLVETVIRLNVEADFLRVSESEGLPLVFWARYLKRAS